MNSKGHSIGSEPPSVQKGAVQGALCVRFSLLEQEAHPATKRDDGGGACTSVAAELTRVLTATCDWWPEVHFEKAANDEDISFVVGEDTWLEEAVRRHRSRGRWVPLICAANGPCSGARLLEAGADEVIAPGHDPRELRARIKAVLRRTDERVRHLSEVEVDRSTLRVRIRDTVAKVSPRQVELFAQLAERREHWVDTDELISKAAGTHHERETSLVRVQIHRLRKALGDVGRHIRSDGRRRYMLTIR